MVKDDMEIKQFELIPIGKIVVNQRRGFIHVLSNYKQALKHLGSFSHAIIFLENVEGHEQCNSSIIEKAEGENSSIIKPITVKIINVDEKTGIIEIDNSMINTDTIVYDIKPYFPCEDRVKNPTTPNSMREWPQWRPEVSLDKLHSSIDNININTETSVNKISKIQQIGVVRKIDGGFYLKLNKPSLYLINQIREFSHVKVLWWFDRFDKSTYRKVTEGNPPYENAPRTGIFASRSPVRPNPIALTTARVLNSDVQSGLIKISQIEAFDNTPIIDIMPYIPESDRIKEYYVPEWLKHWPQWLDDRENNLDIGDRKIIDSDIMKIQKYMSSNFIDKSTEKKFFETTQVKIKASNDIEIIGARQNNLKGISCKIPRNKFTVITGVSGSGKSSLAFDTIYAESQRRFMDSMSVTGKALFEQMAKPDFDQITGLPPAVAIEQKTVGRNRRSTVGTMTDIYDYLRLLFSKIGIRHCPECGEAVTPLKTDEIINLLSNLATGTNFEIKPYQGLEATTSLIVPEASESKVVFNKDLKESVIKALDIGNGAIEVNINKSEVFLFQTKNMCYPCSRIFFDLTTSTFSFNNPESMCPVCKGLGVKLEVDPELIVANPDKSILDEASEWWGNLRKHRQKPNANWMRGEILALADEMKVNLELPWRDLPESFKRQALYGSDAREVRFTYENTNGRRGEIVRPVEGAYNCITRLFKESSGDDTASRIAAAFMRESKCNGCHGERLSAEGRLISIEGTRFPETVVMTIDQLRDWIISLPQRLSKDDLRISTQILKELKNRLENLIDVGVPYLTLDRSVPTLSGGEAQRLRLATQLGSGITNILYVLDEPSIGLHPKDHQKLIRVMQGLRDEGNTIIAVEHDADTMLAADNIIDIGPGAGVNGGLIIAEGTPEAIMLNKQSITGKFLETHNIMAFNSETQQKKASAWIKLNGAKSNNLKNIDISIPLGQLTCVTGVSGSGKSSLITKTLYPALNRLLNKSDDIPGLYDSIEGVENIDQIISISQQVIGRTPRSNPATYTGVFDSIRSLFASLEESKQKGYKQNKFSFNSKEGQCLACNGEGRKCIEMHFMPDVWVECSVCHGRRFNKEALEISYKGKTIADVLDMNVEEALYFFNNIKAIAKILQTLNDVGLGYIKLGQSALTLSGGEAQRLKLAKELSKEDTGNTIYLLDEPTTGLHFADVQNLLLILHRITQAGNTVLVIEHNLDVIKNSDWIIDLGPEGGSDGGYVIAQGTPLEIAEIAQSYTGQYLRKLFITNEVAE